MSKLILTLVCRDEDDIVDSMIDFHLNRGVDFVVAMDNASNDQTRIILQKYQEAGLLHLIDQPMHIHDQSTWVTSLARIAVEEYGADWVINADADEFWWPSRGNLKAELAKVPSGIFALKIDRHNFFPPAVNLDCNEPFYETMTHRCKVSVNSLGMPLRPKVCHRGDRLITVADGNHSVHRSGQAIEAHPCSNIEILHFPVRSYAQLERKITQGATAIEANSRLTGTKVGSTWKNLYHEYFLRGKLPEYYFELSNSGSVVNGDPASERLVIDRRLQSALRGLMIRRAAAQ